MGRTRLTGLHGGTPLGFGPAGRGIASRAAIWLDRPPRLAIPRLLFLTVGARAFGPGAGRRWIGGGAAPARHHIGGDRGRLSGACGVVLAQETRERRSAPAVRQSAHGFVARSAIAGVKLGRAL